MIRPLWLRDAAARTLALAASMLLCTERCLSCQSLRNPRASKKDTARQTIPSHSHLLSLQGTIPPQCGFQGPVALGEVGPGEGEEPSPVETHNALSRLLCPACTRELAPRLAGYCPGCGLLHDQEDAPVRLCGECLRQPRPWDGLFFHGAYQGRLKRLLLAFKFNQGLGNTRLLQTMASQTFRLRNGASLPDVLVPVPLHSRRLAWRGYNQSLELAGGLARELGRPVSSTALARIRHTPPQAGLEARERRINLLGAFRADPAQVRGRHILLVDDIMTTGVTIEQCALALKAAGAAVVDVLVMARA